jgi:uncharacterized protein YneF (UPF0154 family)
MWENIEETLSAAVERILNSLAGLLPTLIALLVVLLLATLAALLIRLVLRRALQGVKFDARLEQWGFSAVAELSPGKSPTLLVCRIVSWSVILFGLLAGLVAVRVRFTSQLLIHLFEYLPHLLTALLVLFFGSLLARFSARGVLLRAVNMGIHSARLVSEIVKWLLMVVVYAMALDQLGIGGDIVKIAFALIFGGVVLALALALGLGSRELVSRAWDKQLKEPPPKEEDTVRHV